MSQLLQAGQNGSILVVDDNPLIVNVLKSLLNSAGYSVYTSSNGGEALDVLNHKSIDVIICDVMMPNMDGYELHDVVRKNSELSHIPFIFLTALGSESDVCRGREAGADDYIVKPFDPKELLSTVKGKVSRSRSLRNLSEERYEAYRKRVIHTLSHEFRTPLVAINTGTELLMEQENFDAAKGQKLLEAIRRGGQRLERLVNDFMLLQQIEAGISQKLYDTRATVRLLDDMIQSFADAQSSNLQQEGFNLKIIKRCHDTRVLIYEPQIHDILSRLVANSVKFKLKDFSIEIHIYKIEREVVIDVRDRGRGIDPARAQEAVDMFGQIDRDKMEQQGGGLGLAIASRYAAINKGRLEFEKREGGGTIVSLILKVADN